MTLLLLILVLLLSFYLIGKIADEYFVESLDHISKRFNMSHDMAGATLMAVGSSAPELFISIIALVKPGDHGEIGIGTIVGSALFNVLVIIGASAYVKRAIVAWQPVVRDLIFYALSILALLWAFYDGVIDLVNAVVLLALYGAYLIAVFNWRKWFPYSDDHMEEEAEEEEPQQKKTLLQKILYPIDKTLGFLFPSSKHYYAVFSISVLIIAALSWVLVESAVEISHILQIPEAIVALTILAAGTSIPDLMSSVIVARQGRGAMAISNAFGSNIFDILIGLGFPWALGLWLTNANVTVSTDNMYSSIMLLLASVVVTLVLLIVRRWQVSRGFGLFFITLYAAYVVWAIIHVV